MTDGSDQRGDYERLGRLMRGAGLAPDRIEGLVASAIQSNARSGAAGLSPDTAPERSGQAYRRLEFQLGRIRHDLDDARRRAGREGDRTRRMLRRVLVIQAAMLVAVLTGIAMAWYLSKGSGWF